MRQRGRNSRPPQRPRAGRAVVTADGGSEGGGEDPLNRGSEPNAGGGAYTAVSAGQLHTCAIRTDRTVRCWGNDNSGQVSGITGDPTPFRAISAGQLHTCGLKEDGGLKCWGY